MSLLQDALRAGLSRPQQPAPGAQVLVAGGGGALGSALLEALLAHHGHAGVSVLVKQPLQTALRGLSPVLWPEPASNRPLPATAVIVFDRARGANGRDEAFFSAQPEALPTLAAQLHARGVRHLLVVMPHTQATLPDALKRGLASLDEQAVAALGFDHLMFVRSAQAPDRTSLSHPAQRLAHWMLSQLQMMVPQREQPLRAQKVAQFAAGLTLGLAASPQGTRVVPPEWAWEAAQQRDPSGMASKYLFDTAMGQCLAGVPDEHVNP
jgi:hypothetical protein